MAEFIHFNPFDDDAPIFSKETLINRLSVDGVASEKDKKKFSVKLDEYIKNREEIKGEYKDKRAPDKEPSQKKYLPEELDNKVEEYKKQRDKMVDEMPLLRQENNQVVVPAEKEKNDQATVLWDAIVRIRDNKNIDGNSENIYKKNDKLKKWFKLMKNELKEIAKDSEIKINECLEKYEIFFNKIL
jgi:flagellar biosynthesis GTPase FlhF